jgi:hypothetical protein
LPRLSDEEKEMEFVEDEYGMPFVQNRSDQEVSHQYTAL